MIETEILLMNKNVHELVSDIACSTVPTSKFASQ